MTEKTWDFDFVDVNGLGGGLALGVHQAGGQMLARTGYLDLGRKLVFGNYQEWGDGWYDGITPGELDPAKWCRVDASVLVAVPPCSGFSGLTGRGAAANTGVEKAHAGSKYNDCIHRTAAYAARVRPEVYLFESVTGAWVKGRELMQQIRAMVEEVSGEQYYLTHVLHDGLSLGSPASRRRYLFVLTKGNRPFTVVNHPVLDQPTTLREAIGDLGGMGAVRGDQPYHYKDEDLTRVTFGTKLRRADGMVDGMWSRGTTAWERRTVQALRIAEAEGMPWQEGTDMGRVLGRLEALDKQDAQDPDAAHQADRVLRVFEQNEEAARRLAGREFEFGAFKIWRWRYDTPGRVVTGGGPRYTVHPTENRNLTLRELARMMGYPDDVRMDTEEVRKEKLTVVWGKNVAVPVGKWVGQSVGAWLAEDDDGMGLGVTEGEVISDRESLIDGLEDSRRLNRVVRANIAAADRGE